ncbi:unnamed protein product, partial [Medioppia subpectinata]
LLNNLLGKMKIKCDYRDRGCPVVTALEGLREHTDNCPFSLRLCNKCYCLSKVSHNCVEELLALNKKESERCEELRQEKRSFDEMRDKLVAENATLRKDNDRLKAELKKFTDKSGNSQSDGCVAGSGGGGGGGGGAGGRPYRSGSKRESPSRGPMAGLTPIPRTSSTQSLMGGELGRPTIYEMLTEGRRHLNQRVTITESNTDEMAANKIVAVVKNELRFNNNMYYICQNIVYKLDHELGSSWCVITNYNKLGHNYTNSSCYVKLKFGKLTFKIYRTKFLDVPLMRRRVRDGKIQAKIRVFDTDMTESMIKYVENITFTALKKHKTLKSIAGEVKTKMDEEYGGHWNCFAHNFGDYCLNRKDKTFISFDVDELKITVFQAN